MDELSERTILTTKEVADLLRVSLITVRRWLKSGKIPSIRIGKHYRIRRDDIEDLFNEQLKKYEDENENNNSEVS
ncbi:helix-turn-helix domain-containing protein [Patescibacteria group bacterium]|nr:helix-turn-helix domain-containing protein [Patescibacteria group bacterium]MBU1673043.1 helix-turn-helix domain-containing protein [Patescibacteria group bacterium]MBU1963603.1 helix-turn-helix domain-containing protein [Patescibacteria group bacterium]